MNSPNSIPISPADQSLLEDLGQIAAELDPAPPLVTELGRTAFLMRRVDAELAQLVADSLLETAGVRSAHSGTRLLSFEAGDLCVEVQVSPVGDQLLVLGQVAPSPSKGEGVVRLEGTGGALDRAELDDLGSFRFDAVRPGLARLHVTLPDAQPVTTSWVTL